MIKTTHSQLHSFDTTTSPEGQAEGKTVSPCPLPSVSVPPPVAPKSWWRIIDEAEARRNLADGEFRLACDYVTCACGHQDPRIPRDPETACPLDDTLADLGLDFPDALMDREWDAARRILAKIEKRSTEILYELGHLTPVSEVLS